MTLAEKDCIDRWSLESLLTIWRFSEPGNRWLRGDTGKYFADVMFAKRDADHDAWVRASKAVGWEGG